MPKRVKEEAATDKTADPSHHQTESARKQVLAGHQPNCCNDKHNGKEKNEERKEQQCGPLYGLSVRIATPEELIDSPARASLEFFKLRTDGIGFKRIPLRRWLPSRHRTGILQVVRFACLSLSDE